MPIGRYWCNLELGRCLLADIYSCEMRYLLVNTDMRCLPTNKYTNQEHKKILVDPWILTGMEC